MVVCSFHGLATAFLRETTAFQIINRMLIMLCASRLAAERNYDVYHMPSIAIIVRACVMDVDGVWLVVVVDVYESVKPSSYWLFGTQ